jgi:hypothetical protein
MLVLTTATTTTVCIFVQWLWFIRVSSLWQREVYERRHGSAQCTLGFAMSWAQRPAEYGITPTLLSRIQTYSSRLSPCSEKCQTTRSHPSRFSHLTQSPLPLRIRCRGVVICATFDSIAFFGVWEGSVRKEQQQQQRWFRGGRRRDWNGRFLALLRCKLLRILLYRRSYPSRIAWRSNNCLSKHVQGRTCRLSQLG